VRVNAVAPGLIDTPWTEDWETVRGYVRVAPLKRSGTPEDVADVIVALASSAYVTARSWSLTADSGSLLGGGGTKSAAADTVTPSLAR